MATREGLGGGLAEVELPMSYKVKNIEDTERAKREKLIARALKKEGVIDDDFAKNSAVSGSLTANYSTHSKQYQSNRGRRGGGAANSAGVKRSAATDGMLKE